MASRTTRAGVAALLALSLTSLLDACGSERSAEPQAKPPGEKSMSLTLTSPIFTPNGEIPTRFTCDGDDISPQLDWSGVPAGAQSLVLIMDDPDAPDPAAPKMTYVHWVLYNLPATSTGLPEAVAPKALPTGTLQGLNDWKRTGYGGPCPPIGRHRYFHKLYALDTTLPDMGEPTKDQVLKAMEGHVLEQTELVGTFQR
jgi:Raf kinase inhibitor-like YbhB/YbcL family protein